MAISTLVKDVLYRVSVQLHDIDPQFTRWTQLELVTALNDGQRAIAKYLPSSCARVDVIKLQTGTRQSIETILAANILPGNGSSPSNVSGNYLTSVIRNMGADGATPGKAIRLADREMLDVSSPDWHTETSTSVSQYTFDPRTPKVFYVSPGVPAGSNVWTEISHLANPTDVNPNGSYAWNGSDTTHISIDDKFVDDLFNYILARAYMKDSESADNAALASASAQLFTASLNAQVGALTGINPNLRVLPVNPTASVAAAPRNA